MVKLQLRQINEFALFAPEFSVKWLRVKGTVKDDLLTAVFLSMDFFLM